MKVGLVLRGLVLVCVTVLVALMGNPRATADDPQPGPAVTGIPMPCVVSHEWPADASLDEIVTQLQTNYSVKLDGAGWTNPEYRGLVKIVWQTLDGMACTPFLGTINERLGRDLPIRVGPISGFAWGDWSLTRSGWLSFDFAKWNTALDTDPGRLVRLMVHEMAHVYSYRQGSSEDAATFASLYRRVGKFSAYGNNSSETYAEIVGYYVGRCALDNPYDSDKYDAYYEFVRQTVFGGWQFGPLAGEEVDCSGIPTVIVPGAEVTVQPSNSSKDDEDGGYVVTVPINDHPV